jgi:hypothetical protein
LPTSLAQHEATFGHPLAVLTADRAFVTLANDQLAHAVGIHSIALPRQDHSTSDNTEPRFGEPTVGEPVSKVALVF